MNYPQFMEQGKELFSEKQLDFIYEWLEEMKKESIRSCRED